MGRQWPEWCGHAMSVADPEREWDDSTRVCVKCQEPWPCAVVQARYSQKAQQPAQDRAGEEIAGRDSRGCQPRAIEAQEGSGAARACAHACPWQPIATAPGLPVLVSRPNDSRYFYTPTTAYRDAIGVWRLFRSSPGGMQRLPFCPTHWLPLPEPPKVSR